MKSSIERLSYRAALAVTAVAICAGAQEPQLVIQSRSPGASIAFSRDGRYIATTDEGGPTLLWETATGRLFRELPPGNQTAETRLSDRTMIVGSVGGGGQAVVFSPDGRYVAAVPMSLARAMNGGDWSGQPPGGVWVLATGRPLAEATWQNRDGILHNASLPWTASELIAWGAAKDSAAAHALARYSGPIRVIDAAGRVGIALEGARSARTISIHELPSGREIARLPQTYNDAWRMALSADGHFFAVSSQLAGVDVWDLRTLTKVGTVDRKRYDDASVITFSPDGSALAIAGMDRVVGIRIPHLTTALDIQLAPRGTHPFEASDLAYSSDGRLLAVAQGIVYVVDVSTQRVVRHLDPSSLEPIGRWAIGSRNVAIARESQAHCERCFLNASLELWSLVDGTARTLSDSIIPVSALSFSPGDSFIVAGHLAPTTVSRYTQVYVGGLSRWRTSDGVALDSVDIYHARLGMLDAHPLAQLGFSANGTQLLAVRYVDIPTTRNCPYVACGEDETTNYRVWLDRAELGSKAKPRSIRFGLASTEDASVFAISPRGDAILVHDQRGSRRVDARSGATSRSFRTAVIDSAWPAGRPSNLHQLRFSDDGTRFLAVRDDALLVGEASTGALRYRRWLSEPNVAISFATFMPGTGSSVAFVTHKLDAPGSVLREIDLATGAEREVIRFDDTVDEVVFASGGHVWVRAASVTRVYDRDRGLLLSMLRAADGGWLVVTPDHRYDFDGTGALLVAWRVGDRTESITSVRSFVRVPHLLAEVLGGR